MIFFKQIIIWKELTPVNAENLAPTVELPFSNLDKLTKQLIIYHKTILNPVLTSYLLNTYCLLWFIQRSVKENYAVLLFNKCAFQKVYDGVS